MFQAWRIKLREVDEALKSGRLDDASRLLLQGDLRTFYPAQQMQTKLAAQLLDRGRTRTHKGETAAGWHDLEQAEKLGADAAAAGLLRRQLVEQGMAEAEEYLAAGSCEACLAAIEKLERRGGAGHETRELKQAAHKYDDAIHHMRRGKFAQAMDALSIASSLRPDLKCIEQAAQQCQEKRQQCSLLQEALHKELAAENWPDVLHTADQMLQRAPDWRIALDARQKAWAHVGMQVTGAGVVRMREDANGAQRVISAGAFAAEAEPDAVPHSPRFLLWIDGVGGYLVCESDEVLIGQPAAGGQIDVPILGDISRQHARIHRNGEGYLLQPLRKTKVNGRSVEGWHTLADGQLIELGEGVQLRFCRPHALSTTARLEFASHHRTQPAADAVILMSDSFILGTAASSHVVCRNWTRQLVIFRQDGELYCRTSGAFQVDGRPCEGEGRLTRHSQVVGDDFSFSLEELI
jgi:hypothetical protein